MRRTGSAAHQHHAKCVYMSKMHPERLNRVFNAHTTNTTMDTKHDHSKLFRAGIKKGDGSRRREETSIRIRKKKRQQRMHKRRVTTSPVAGPLNIDINLLYNGTDAQKLDTLTKIRKTLSQGEHPPIAEVARAGLIPLFIAFLQRNDNCHLQFEAAWTLTNLASGATEHTKAIVDANCVPPLVALLNSPSEDVREQVVWALGNIAGDCVTFRDVVLNNGCVNAILSMFRPHQHRVSMIKNVTWLFSNMCRGKPYADLSFIRPMIPALAWLVQHEDENVVSDACWALCYISDGDTERIEAVVSAGVCMRLVELMNHPSPAVQTPALRTIGNIVTGPDKPTQTVVDSGAIPVLKSLLHHRKGNIKKEAAWALSNITAGTHDQIQQVLNAKVISQFVEMLSTEEFSIKKEIAWAIANATSGGTESQIEYMVHAGCVEALVDLADSYDTGVTLVILETFENILKAGQKDRQNRGLPTNPYTELMESCGAMDMMDGLQDHEDLNVNDIAVRMLEQFFGAEDESAPLTFTEPPAQTIFDFATGFK